MTVIFRQHSERQKKLRAEHAAVWRDLQARDAQLQRDEPAVAAAQARVLTGRRAEAARKRALHAEAQRQYERRFELAALGHAEPGEPDDPEPDEPDEADVPMAAAAAAESAVPLCACGAVATDSLAGMCEPCWIAYQDKLTAARAANQQKPHKHRRR